MEQLKNTSLYRFISFRCISLISLFYLLELTKQKQKEEIMAEIGINSAISKTKGKKLYCIQFGGERISQEDSKPGRE